MTHSVSNLHEAQTVIVGVDTHVAVAIDSRGIRLGAHSFGADSVDSAERWKNYDFIRRLFLREPSVWMLDQVPRPIRLEAPELAG